MSSSAQVLQCIDLLEEIIDWLWAEGDFSLFNSRRQPPRLSTDIELISKSWLLRSRSHRFRFIELTPSKASGFFSLMSSPHETISQHIQTVQIADDLSDIMRKFTLFQRLRQQSLSFPFRLEKVKTIIFRQLAVFPFSKLDPLQRNAFVTMFAAVQELKFLYCLCIDVREVFSMMEDLARIERLEFDSELVLGAMIGRKSSPSESYVPRQLKSLTCRCTMPRFPWDSPWQWVSIVQLLDGQYSSLRKLHLEGFTPAELEGAGKIIESLKSTLEELSLKFDEDHSNNSWRGRSIDSENLLKALKLSSWPSLRCLRIRSWIPFDSSIHQAVMQSLSAITDQVASPQLEELEFDVNLSLSTIETTINSIGMQSELNSGLVDFGLIKAHLSSRNVWNLRMLRFIIDAYHLEKEDLWMHRLQEEFLEFHKEGVLQVVRQHAENGYGRCENSPQMTKSLEGLDNLIHS